MRGEVFQLLPKHPRRPAIDDLARFGRQSELGRLPAFGQFGFNRFCRPLTRAGISLRVGMGGGVRIIFIGGEGKGGVLDCPRRVLGLSLDIPRRVPFCTLSSCVLCPLFRLFRLYRSQGIILRFKRAKSYKDRLHGRACVCH